MRAAPATRDQIDQVLRESELGREILFKREHANSSPGAGMIYDTNTASSVRLYIDAIEGDKAHIRAEWVLTQATKLPTNVWSTKPLTVGVGQWVQIDGEFPASLIFPESVTA